MKATPELGSERRDTVRSISGVGVRVVRGCTRGPEVWCTSYRANGRRWVAMYGKDNR